MTKVVRNRRGVARADGSRPSMEVHVRINGEKRRWTIAPGDILLDVLRREGYLGVKRGCESGECGACTVLVNGRAVTSCLMFAAQAQGCDLLTIEGLAEGDTLHPIQQAYLEYGAVQCGFCTPGMILNTKALLDRRPQPSEEEVRDMLAGNFCRCTGYHKPIEAVLGAALAIRQETPRRKLAHAAGTARARGARQ